MHQYVVCGRALPTESTPKPEIFRMTIFAKNEMIAQSRFWYYVKRMQKIKRVNGEIVACKEIFENSRYVKNYGIWLRYRSRTGQHNMYKEIRDVTAASAVEKLYNDMAGQCRARYGDIQIMSVATVAAKDCVREATKVFHSQAIAFPPNFPLIHAKRRKGSRFAAKRPTCPV
eukprot:gnl/Dysnectes_brevis/71_a88_13351.p2 GENE.gnl/Dysnectes_brevis/71_a88_13351~~gnl/Dysnectes_brevis/71_a88_13351.p2  ORF type:complete len:172 (+),score=35.09 gnl/Dysnectes_brevis/71_a88_13351:32-547(+)